MADSGILESVTAHTRPRKNRAIVSSVTNFYRRKINIQSIKKQVSIGGTILNCSDNVYPQGVERMSIIIEAEQPRLKGKVI